MEKLSRFLTGAMLALFCLLMAGAVGLSTVGNLAHPSYAAALAGGALLALLWPLLKKRLAGRQLLCERLGPGKTCLLLALLCFALNGLWVLLMPLEPVGDPATFWQAAVDLARGEAPQNRVYIALFPHILGYSAFLSLFIRLFGESLRMAGLLNVALNTLSGVLLYRSCLRWRGERSAAFAFLLWALLPSKLLYGPMVISEPFYTCLLLAVIWLLGNAEEKIGQGCALMLCLAAGLVCALLLSMVNAARPIAAVPIIAFVIWLLLLRGPALRDREQWKRWGLFTLVLLLAYVGLGRLWNGYAARTLEETPAPIPGYNIYVGFNPESMGTYSEPDMDLLTDYRYTEGSSAVIAQQKMFEEAKARIRSGQVPFGRLFVSKLRSFMGNDEGGVFYTYDRFSHREYVVWSLVCNVYYYALILLALWGVYSLWQRREQRVVLTVPLYVIGLTLAQMLVEVAGRYHYSIVPMLIILAACTCGEPTRR